MVQRGESGTSSGFVDSSANGYVPFAKDSVVTVDLGDLKLSSANQLVVVSDITSRVIEVSGDS